MALTIKGLHRVCLWLLLIVLTVTVLVVPTHLTFEYYAVQSTRIFDNLPLFSGLFCVWLATLLLLLFSHKNEGKNDWEKLALVCIFSAVFLGFWTIITHNQLNQEGINHAAHVKYLSEVGKIPLNNPSLSYFDFPGLHLIGVFVSQAAGVDAISTAAIFTLFQAMFLAVLLYVLFSRLLNNYYGASLAVLLVIQGNISLDKLNIFHPRNLGLVMLATFLVIVTRRSKGIFRTMPDTVIMLTVVVATAMTHSVTSFLLFSIIAGIYIVQKFKREKTENASSLVLLVVIPLVWAMYWAIITFRGVLATFPKVLSDLIERKDVLWFFTMMQKANVGESLPQWSNMTRLFWWVVIYGLGSILGLWNFLRIKKLSLMEQLGTGTLLGIIIISAFSTFASLGGARFDTYILYGAFALVPILLWFLLKLRSSIWKYALSGFAVIFFILSFPTFLSHNNMVEVNAWYPNENASGALLESKFGKGDGGYIFGDEWMCMLMRYYIPNAQPVAAPSVLYLRDEAGLWMAIDKFVTSFEDQRSQKGYYIFMWSDRLTVSYEHFFGVTKDNPKWQDQINRLSRQNKFYDNRDNQMFMLVKS